MANTRKGCKGTVFVRTVKQPFDEWLMGLIDHTEKKGSRECRMCGDLCDCHGVRTTEDGICLVWKCNHGHMFKQEVSLEDLQRMYRKANPRKYENETVFLSKYRKKDIPKKWRAIV
jgi:hypothetical protein